MWQSVPLDYKSFLQSHRAFVQVDDQFSRATEILMDSIKKLNKSRLKWLIIGPGSGGWEAEILQSIGELNGAIELELIEAWEPNPCMFQHLKKLVEEDKIWGENLSGISLKNQAMTVDASFDETYDLITVPHVFYFMEQKQTIIEMLESVLKPDGILYTLCLIPELDGKIDQATQFMKKFMGKICFKEDTEIKRHVRADYTYSGYELYDLFKQTLAGKNISFDMKCWKSYLDMGKLDEKDEFLIDILCYIVQCDFRILPQAAKDEIFLWLRENIDFNEQEKTFKIFQPNLAIIAHKK